MDSAFTIRVSDERTVVRVTGDLDVMLAPQWRERFADLVRHGHHDLVVDLDAVGFLDSTGLAVLVNALKRVRAHGGQLRVVCSNEATIHMLRVTGLINTFTIYATSADALAADERNEALERAVCF